MQTKTFRLVYRKFIRPHAEETKPSHSSAPLEIAPRWTRVPALSG